jgi:hypothetical protein
MSTTAEPAKENLTDPLIADILERIGKSSDEIKAMPEDQVKTEIESPTEIHETLAQRAVRFAQENPEPKTEDAKPEPAKAPPAQASPDQKTAVTKKAQLKPAPPVVQPQAPAPVVQQPSPPPKVEPEPADSLVLTDDQQELLSAAEWGEKTIPELKGKASELKSYFKKLSSFISENPDATEDSEEFDKFQQKHKPKISQAAINKATRGQLLEEAQRLAEEKLRPQIEEVKGRLRSYEAKPDAEREVSNFKESLAKSVIEEADSFSDVIKLVSEDPEKAEEEHPIEAPIAKQALKMAETYVGINRSIVPFNQANKDHIAISGFLFTQSDKMKQLPPEKQLRRGKMFLDLNEFSQAITADPNAINKYWTFTEQDVLEMIKAKAVKEARLGRDKVRRAHEKMTKKPASAAPQKTQEVASPAAPVPIAKGIGKPAAHNEIDGFIKQLVPGMA